MATSNFITLADRKAGGSQVSKRFKAIAMRMPYTRTDSIEYTISGQPDKHSGNIIRNFQYVLRIPQDQPVDQNYGCFADLVTLFQMTNPNADPPDYVLLTDHYGDSHTCFFVGSMEPEPLTTMLEGPNAWHIVPIDLLEFDAGERIVNPACAGVSASAKDLTLIRRIPMDKAALVLTVPDLTVT